MNSDFYDFFSFMIQLVGNFLSTLILRGRLLYFFLFLWGSKSRRKVIFPVKQFILVLLACLCFTREAKKTRRLNAGYM